MPRHNFIEMWAVKGETTQRERRKSTVLTVNQQLCALIDGLVGEVVVGPAGVNALITGLNVVYPKVQPGAGRWHQRLVAGRCSSEGPGELLGRVRGGGAVEGDGWAAVDDERPVGKGGGRRDGCGYVHWTTWKRKEALTYPRCELFFYYFNICITCCVCKHLFKSD